VAGASITASPSSASVVRTVRCCGRVPHCTEATGVSGASPPAISRSAMAPRVAAPMSTTMVPPTRATASQSVSTAAHGSSCPVTTVNDVERPRCVTGTPAYAGTATAEVTPGTTSKGTPASSRANASSPPRANTNGSPPLSRTTSSPALPFSTSRALISSCEVLGPLGVLPTLMRSAVAGATSSNDDTDSRS
jgi:hypothetical protein